MTQTSSVDPVFASYHRLMRTIVAQFGANCQVTLYDLRAEPAILIAVAGALVSRPIGSPLPSSVLQQLTANRHTNDGRSLFASATPDGRRVSSSLTLLHDARGRRIGCICIDLCIENIIASINVLQNFCSLPPVSNQIENGEDDEGDVATMTDGIIDTMIRKFSGHSANIREDRIKLVAELEKKGIFRVKGAVESVAQRLNVSKFTIYSYLDQLKEPDEPPKPRRNSP